MSLTVTGTDPTSCTEMKVWGGAMMERSTEGECSQVLEARQVKPRLGAQRGSSPYLTCKDGWLPLF